MDGWKTVNSVGWLLCLWLLLGVYVDLNVIHTAFVIILLVGFDRWDVVRCARLLLLFLVKLAEKLFQVVVHLFVLHRDSLQQAGTGRVDYDGTLPKNITHRWCCFPTALDRYRGDQRKRRRRTGPLC
ncbi:hypothetical protein Krac_10971 [Ktedonobacter racemifer DSM 44963]|uniref:Uncharacterized protein n=1 Tax=Ktedonobacter racemifer DSM 44963 TaxID=485913 RepID=D6TJ10_KTERA|nr:hypothetical protein Krac_10971 [Ktedonobacter racemifer DSM 44963]